MYLRKNINKNTGRTYLSIAHNYRDKNTKCARAVIIKSLGYLDELEKEYPDPIEFYTSEAKKMEEQRRLENASLTFTIAKNELIPTNSFNRKNFGAAAISKIYHELKIDTFLINRQRYTKEEYDANAIMKLIIFSRLLYPASKKKTHENRDIFFEKFDFSLDDIYRCLSLFKKRSNDLQLWIHEQIKTQYNRNTDLVYYDVTNYYFEIDEQDDFRRDGCSKEHRPDPIVQMGLFIDTNGIPITYKLFPGNKPDKTTLIPALGEIHHNYSLGKVIVVADRGLTTGNNIWYILSAKNGYVLSYSIRCADQKFQDYVLNENGYINKGYKDSPLFHVGSINKGFYGNLIKETKSKLLAYIYKRIFNDDKYKSLLSEWDEEKFVKAMNSRILSESDFVKNVPNFEEIKNKNTRIAELFGCENKEEKEIQELNRLILDEIYPTEIEKGHFKIKSRLYPREIKVTSTKGKKIIKTVHEKQVIFYSHKYAQRAKHDRAAVLAKAKDLIKNPAKYNKSTTYGAAKYVKNLNFDKDTGEILESVKQHLSFDQDKLNEEEKFDGYYAIVTSEYKELDEKIIEMYRGLWKIEECFKVTKSDFESRPVYLSLEEHIDAHFLTCFIALVIVRILEYRLKGKYSIPSILESLSKASCSHIKENYYLFDFYNNVLEDIGKDLNIDFSKKIMSLSDIKKILGDTKKS